MKKLFNIFIVFLLSFVLAGVEGEIFAQTTCPNVIDGLPDDLPAYEEGMSHTMTFDFTGMPASNDYFIKIKPASDDFGADNFQSEQFTIPSNTSGSNSGGSWTINNHTVILTITGKRALSPVFNLNDGRGSNEGYVKVYDGTFSRSICNLGVYTTTAHDKFTGQCHVTIKQNRSGYPNGCFAPGCMAFKEADGSKEPITISVTGLEKDGELFNSDVSGEIIGYANTGSFSTNFNQKAINGNLSIIFNPSKAADFNIGFDGMFSKCNTSFVLLSTCPAENSCHEEPTELPVGGETSTQNPFSLCNQIPENLSTQKADCISCTEGSEDAEENQGVWTAIGCIKRDAGSIMEKLITVGLGISGGVALLTFLAAGFIYSTSQGDPKAYGKAKEMMTASIVGILFVIFSVTILQFIGYEILKIPGFGGV